MKQLAFDLPHRPALGGDDFLVAPSNEEAVLWLDRWPDWPSHALAIYGPSGCGKTHLAHVFAAKSKATFLNAGDLTSEAVPDLLVGSASIVLEGAEGGVDETALFHLFNATKEADGYLLLTGQAAPARWSVSLPDLTSRLSAIPSVGIGAPDDTLMAAVLVKLFMDRQLTIGEDVVTYLLRHMERSFSAARALVATADSLALAEKRAVTVPLVKKALG